WLDRSTKPPNAAIEPAFCASERGFSPRSHLFTNTGRRCTLSPATSSSATTKMGATENNSFPTPTPAGRQAPYTARSSPRPAASSSKPTITIRPDTMPTLSFRFVTAAGSRTAELAIRQAILAGWTGRDRAAVERHMEELAIHGVKRPPSIPVFYRCAAARLNTADAIEVTGEDSSGEVEYVLIQAQGSLWVGVGSDQTDRKVEGYNITVSKQMCDKPMAPELW